MQHLNDLAQGLGEQLIARGETISIGEGACGGLLSAALVGVPGASGFFVAGAVLYTRPAFKQILGDSRYALRGMRGGTEDFSLTIAELVRQKFDSTWAIGESGASGPTGNRYGDPAGHVALGVSGPVRKARIVETGLDDRRENMRLFATAALELLAEALAECDAG